MSYPTMYINLKELDKEKEQIEPKQQHICNIKEKERLYLPLDKGLPRLHNIPEGNLLGVLPFLFLEIFDVHKRLSNVARSSKCLWFRSDHISQAPTKGMILHNLFLVQEKNPSLFHIIRRAQTDLGQTQVIEKDWIK